MGTSLQIQLEDFRHFERRSPHSAGRYTTTASVRLLDAHTIVCCSHLACKISLIRFDLGFCQYTVVDSENTACGGDLTETTLCDIDGRGHVVTSNGEDGNMGLYGVAGGKIWHARDLPTVAALGPPGVSIFWISRR